MTALRRIARCARGAALLACSAPGLAESAGNGSVLANDSASLVRTALLLALIAFLPTIVVCMTSFLRIAVSYDAGERSLEQLAGNVDFFLRGLRGEFLAPLEQTLPLLSALSRLPCFPGQCNE